MLQSGDIILVTGSYASSRKLVSLQKQVINSAKSSHVVIAHAETLCIDARQKVGVQHSFILDALNNIEPDWCVIRRNGITEDQKDLMIKSAAFYLSQPYLVHPSGYIGKSRAYCSELARKIYEKSGIELEVPSTGLVMPAHFDLLSQGHPSWSVITDEVKSWLEEVKADEKNYRLATSTMVNGLKLNRKRFDDRKKMKEKIIKMGKKGLISNETKEKQLAIINKIEEKMIYTFWDK